MITVGILGYKCLWLNDQTVSEASFIQFNVSLIYSKSESQQSVQTSVEGKVHPQPVLGQSRHAGGGAVFQGRTKEWGVFGNVSVHSGQICWVYSPLGAKSWERRCDDVEAKSNVSALQPSPCGPRANTYRALLYSNNRCCCDLVCRWACECGCVHRCVLIFNNSVHSVHPLSLSTWLQTVPGCVYEKALVRLCAGGKLICAGSLSIRGSCAHRLWNMGEDTWSSCSQWTRAVASPSLTFVPRRSTNLMNGRTNWTTMSVAILLQPFSL